MRKVYEAEKTSTGLALALFLGAGVTAVLFGIIPFSHIIAKPSSLVQLRQASTADLPPPVADEPPPVVAEPEKKEEAPPELQIADAAPQIALSADLEVATGTGGGLAGFGVDRAMTATQSVQEDAFDVGDLEKKPEILSQVAPNYPPELRKLKISGTVILNCVLTEAGRVEEARVETSSRPEFEKPALEAINKWRYRPGMKDGKAVKTFISVPIRFSLPK